MIGERSASGFLFIYLISETLYIRILNVIFICAACFNEYSLSLNFCTRAISEISNAGGSGKDAEEEFEWQVLEELEAYTTREAERLLERALQPRVPRPRPVVHRRAVTDRDHVAAHQRLYDDYFAEQPRFGDNLFRRRFRMSRELFMRIVDALER